MRPYVLNYSKVIKICNDNFIFDESKQTNQIVQVDVTTQTFTMESSDDDSVMLTTSTKITETIENSDEDYLCISQSTLVTNVIESGDSDELSDSFAKISPVKKDRLSGIIEPRGFGLTWTTETIEPSDEDELHLFSGTTLITKVSEPSDDECSPH